MAEFDDQTRTASGLDASRRLRGRRRAQFGVLAAVSLGGMLGASARHGVTRWLPAQPGDFPWPTFWANLSGSFLLGLLLAVLLARSAPSRLARPFLATGVLGAFTTMSTYQVETALLIDDGHPATGVLYGIGSLVAGLVLAYVGVRAGRLISSHTSEVIA